jgi:hypothetical protein
LGVCCQHPYDPFLSGDIQFSIGHDDRPPMRPIAGTWLNPLPNTGGRFEAFDLTMLIRIRHEYEAVQGDTASNPLRMIFFPLQLLIPPARGRRAW